MPDIARHPSTTHLLRYFDYSHLPERLHDEADTDEANA